MAYNVTGDLNVGRRLELGEFTNGQIATLPGVDGGLIFNSTNNELNLYHSGVWNSVTGGSNYVTANLTATADRIHDWSTFDQTENFTTGFSNRNYDVGGAGFELQVFEGTTGFFATHANNASTNSATVLINNLGARLRANDTVADTDVYVSTTGIELTLPAGDDLTINGDPGTAGQVITSQGNGNPPTWSTVSGQNIITSDLNQTGNRTQTFSNFSQTWNGLSTFDVTSNGTAGGISLTDGSATTRAYVDLDYGSNGEALFGMEDGADNSFVTSSGSDASLTNINGGDQNAFTVSNAGLLLTFHPTADLRLDGNAGTNGQVFTSNGPGLPPTWTTLSATADYTAIGLAGASSFDAAAFQNVVGSITSAATLNVPANLTVGQVFHIKLQNLTGSNHTLSFNPIWTDNSGTPLGPLGLTTGSDPVHYTGFYDGTVIRMVREFAFSTLIQDTDGDTRVETEQSSDEDIVRVTTSGNEAFQILSQAGANTKMLSVQNGSVQHPVYSWFNEPDTGLYHSGTGASSTVHIGTNGVERFRIRNTGLTLGTGGTDWRLPIARGNTGDILVDTGGGVMAFQAPAAGNNFANANLTSTGNRTHTFTGNTFSLLSATFAEIRSTGQYTWNVSGTQGLMSITGLGNNPFLRLDAIGAGIHANASDKVELQSTGLEVTLAAGQDFRVNANPGAAGEILTSAGTGAPPDWDAPLFIPNTAVPPTPTAGARFYANAGEMFVIDDSGNSTQLSSHDGDGYYIVHHVRGRDQKRIKIDLEQFFRDNYPEYLNEE